MRWAYIIPRLLIVASLWAGLHFGLDPLLRYSAVKTVQSIVGAKADVTTVSTQFFPPRLVVDQVAVASASRIGTNLVEFEHLELRLSGDPLLRKQFVVEEAELRGVRFGTLRTDSGQLEIEPEDDEETEPSWMAEQLRARGTEWLNNMADQARQQLDPNLLETYRTGDEIYRKWDARFVEISGEVRQMKPRVDELKQRFQTARQGDTLQQIEQYIQVAQDADLLTHDALQLKQRMTEIAPEVRTDFSRLDQARRNDIENVKTTIQAFKPNAQTITDATIGEPMYRQLHELISWIQTVRGYSDQLKQQSKPERQRGTDFEFPILHPTPDFHLQKLTVSGDFQVEGNWIPFEAVVTDVTSDAPLLQQPAVMRLKMEGDKPLLLKVTFDATGERAITHVAAVCSEVQPRELSAAKSGRAVVAAQLNNIRWDANLTVVNDQLDGNLRLSCRLDHAHVVSPAQTVRTELLQAANDAFSQLSDVSAELRMSGSLRHPDVDVSSSLGEQISEGVRLAVSNQIAAAQVRLQKEVNDFATDQSARLTSRFNDEYKRLMTEHAQTIQQVQEVRQIVASLRAGRVDAATVFRQAANSSLISDKDKQKAEQVIGRANSALERAGVPGSLQGIVPGLNGIQPGLNNPGRNPVNPASLPGPGVPTLPGVQLPRIQGFPGLATPRPSAAAGNSGDATQAAPAAASPAAPQATAPQQSAKPGLSLDRLFGRP